MKRYIACLIIFSLFVVGCSSEEVAQSSDETLSFSGNGADESDYYFFKDRTKSSVAIFFYEPFFTPPEVTTTNDKIDYSVTDVSNWGFTLTITGNGFWKDTTFDVTGELANNRLFCRETDNGVEVAQGGMLYSLDGIFQDVCVATNFTQIEELFCQNNTLSSVIVECENNCYSDGGPAVCADGTNIEQPCEDNFPGIDYFTQDYVTYNGLVHQDYCIGQIHGTNKQLTEMTCSDGVLLEQNHFCEYGCKHGKCLNEESLYLPELTFGVLVGDNRTLGDVIDFRLFASDSYGLLSIVLEEQNMTDKNVIAFVDCEESTSCNSSFKVKNKAEGLFIFQATAKNFYNNTISKNVSLNFSSDLSGPEIGFVVTEPVLNASNFTDVNITITDNRGLQFFALYEQALNAENILLTTHNCQEKTFCKKSYRRSYNDSGFFTLMVTSMDTDGNTAFETRNIEVRSENATPDALPPELSFAIAEDTVAAGEWVSVDYDVTDDTKLGNIAFYKSSDGDVWEYVSTLSCGNLTKCAGSFIYKHSEIGTLFYMINATDAQANYQFEINSVLYKEPENETRVDTTAPAIALSAVPYEDGSINKTEIIYSASDNNPITYMNLYKLQDGEFLLARTRFCRKQTTCEANLIHSKIFSDQTFLVIAVDVYGNKGELKKTISSDS